jgi:hypothetical protein
MKKIIIMLLVISFVVCSAEKGPWKVELKIAGGELSINGQIMKVPMNKDDYYKALGKPDRVTEKSNTIHTWDKIGVWAFEKPKTGVISCLSLLLFDNPKRRLDFTPKSTFSGILTFDGVKIEANTPPKSLEQLGLQQLIKGVYMKQGEGITLTVDKLGSTKFLSASICLK